MSKPRERKTLVEDILSQSLNPNHQYNYNIYKPWKMGQCWAKNWNVYVLVPSSSPRQRLLHRGEAMCLHLMLPSFSVTKGVFATVKGVFTVAKGVFTVAKGVFPVANLFDVAKPRLLLFSEFFFTAANLFLCTCEALRSGEPFPSQRRTHSCRLVNSSHFGFFHLFA